MNEAINEKGDDSMDELVMDEDFARDVLEGLSASPKRLSSRYFYDAAGDRLFQQIMATPEYYLTDSELEILRTQGGAIAAALLPGGPFELIELGAGDGSKMVHLLDALHEAGADFVYRPVDISPNVLELLSDKLLQGRPWLNIEPLAVNYVDWLAEPRQPELRQVFAFMGANLGNFTAEGSVDFLRTVRGAMNPADALLIGLDLKKDPAIIKAAYNDAEGATKAFNLNLLKRINRELGGDFDLQQFTHQPSYDERSGAARSYLRSETDQQVKLARLGATVQFSAGETIFMEVSQKYDEPMIEALAKASGFAIQHRFYDQNHWFTDQLWVPVT